MARSFFQNTCKPEGFGGKLMVNMMNSGHTAMAEWGFSYIQINDDADVLDIGCGGGANLKTLCKKCSNGHVTGIDYSEVSVEKSKNVNQKSIDEGHCNIIQGNVMQLPFKDESYDVVTAFETIYFWPNLRKAFTNIHRILRNNGIFMICNEADGKNKKDDKWTEKIEGMTIYTAEELKSLLEIAGFKSIAIHENNKHWLTVVASKKI